MKKNVGLLVIATGKYDVFIDNLLESVDKYFLIDHNITIFLFTDCNRYFSNKNLNVIETKHEPWPNPTLKRYHLFHENKELFCNMDYLSYVDVDSLFIDDIEDDILTKFTVCLHWAFVGSSGTPERNPISTAYISEKESNKYYAGGFYIAERDIFLDMTSKLKNNIETDLSNNYIAIWHDESHLNRYLLDNPPELELYQPYFTGEDKYKLGLNRNARLMFLDKNHKEIRK